MTYRWRPHSKWLQKVYHNPDPVISQARNPALKIYWGHQETVSWSEFMAMIEISGSEPALLLLTRDNHPFYTSSVSWKELLQEDAIQATETMSWKELVEDNLPSVENTIQWEALLSRDINVITENAEEKTSASDKDHIQDI